MADYEVLGPGGHAHLVSDIKAYVNRADGVGTTQLADESVTMDKLGDDVTDELDGIVHDGDPLNGNVLIGTIAEGTVLTADDAFAAPPRDVNVYGKSMQVTYTGKNLFDINGVSFGSNAGYSTKTATGVTVTADLASGWAYGVAVVDISGASSVTLSAVPNKSTPRIAIEGRYSDNTVAVTQTALANSVTVTLPDGVVKVRCVFYARQTSSGAVGDMCTYNNIQLELGSTATAYEPYVGGKAAPNPDYPQQILSVDDLTLNVCGKNLYSSGDQTFTQYSMLYISLLAGTYTVSALVTSSDMDTQTCAVIFRYTDGSYSTLIQLGRNTRSYATITLDKPVQTLRFYAAATNDLGAGDTATWKDIQIEVGTTATAYTPYIAPITIPIPLSNHVGRSLPDGTRDTLTLSYIGPSTREGWGVFGVELVQRIGEYDGATLATNRNWNYDSNGYFWVANWNVSPNLLNLTNARMGNVYCNILKAASWSGWLGEEWQVTQTAYLRLNVDTSVTGTTVDAFKTWLAASGLVFCGELREPITHDLGTVELPILPNPLTAWADGGSAQPTLSMSYERDVTIVIEQLEAQIEELLTS